MNRSPGQSLFRFRLLTLLGTGLLVLASAAQAAPSLEEAVQAAMQRHPELPRAEMQRALGAGYRRQADSWLGGDPSASLLYRSDQIGSDVGYREMEAAVSLPLWMPGQRDARQGVAQAIADQADASTALLRWQVRGDVLEQVWQLRLTESDEELADTQWASAQQLESAVARRVAAGELARADLLMVQQDTLSREVDHENTRMALEAALATWRTYTGLDAIPAMPGNQEPLLGRDFGTDHPLLHREQLRIAQLAARRDDSRRTRQSKPELTLYAKRDRGNVIDPYNNSLGAEISVPFGMAYSTAPRVAESEAALARARMDLAAARRNLELERVRLAQDLSRAQTALQLAERQSRLADERMAMNQRAFDLGESGLFLLLEARSQAASAARSLIRSKIDYQRAVSRYNHLLGVTPQ